MSDKKSKPKFGNLQRKLLKLHPGELKNSEAQLILNHIRKSPEFAEAWKNATPALKKKKSLIQ